MNRPAALPSVSLALLQFLQALAGTARRAAPELGADSPAAGRIECRHLPRGHTAWLERPLARQVVCERGTVWLIFDGHDSDVILNPGEFHLCQCDERLAIHALRNATVRFH